MNEINTVFKTKEYDYCLFTDTLPKAVYVQNFNESSQISYKMSILVKIADKL